MASFGAAISEHPNAAYAVGEVVGAVVEAVGEAPDIAFLFVSGHDDGAVEEIATAVRALLQPGVLAGCTAVGVIGNDSEAEEAPAVSLWPARPGRPTARWPGPPRPQAVLLPPAQLLLLLALQLERLPAVLPQHAE